MTELSSNFAWLIIVLIVALIIALAFWTNNAFLYIGALVTLVFFGLDVYNRITGAMGYTLAGVSWFIAAFCLYKVVTASKV